MHANPHELAGIIKRILGKIEISEETEMMVSIFTSPFYKEGILTEAMIKKFRALID